MSGRKKFGKRIALLFTVVFACTLISYFSFTSKLYLKVVCITPATINKNIFATGLGYLKERKRTGYYFDIPVKVEQVYVKVGDKVKAGDPLLKIDLKATELTAKIAAAGIITQESKSVETANMIDYSKKITGNIREALDKIPETVYAAYDCIISGLSAENGEYSNPYSPLVVMSDRSVICAEIFVDERDANGLEIGQKATISGSALDKTYTATVISVAARATMASTDAVTSNKVDVSLELSGANDSLVINSLVKAEILKGVAENIIFVPYEVVHFNDQSDFVYVNENGKAVKKTVKTGRAFEDGIEIVSGITAIDRLILSSKGELKVGCGVREK